MSLALTNIRTTRPTTLTGLGTLLFDVSGIGTADVQVDMYDAGAGQYVNVWIRRTATTPLTDTGPGPLAPGQYRLVLLDFAVGTPAYDTATVGGYQVPVVLGCTDPNANNYNAAATADNGTCTYTPPARLAYLRVPAAQSLRFVQPGAAVPAFDNTLLADETPLGVNNPGYCQLVEQGDTLILQVQSNYTGAPVATVVPLAGGAAVATVAGVRVVRGAGQTAAFAAYLRAEPTNPARSRVYFNAGTLPLPFALGDRVSVGGTTTSNGTYPILAVLEDVAAAVPYLVLGVAYPSAAQRVDCTLASAYAVQAFDTWHLVLSFAAVPAGLYRVRIDVTDTTFAAAYALSEPVEVAPAHADTRLLTWRNFDNAFGLNYTAGLVNRLRVRARFFQRETTTTREVLRESSGRLLLLSAAAYRKVRLDVYLLPDYVHETLAVALCHDFFSVDGLAVVAEEAYTVTPVPHYTLSNATVLLEQTDFLGAGNRDDVGDPNPATGAATLLLANNTYLTVNP